MSIGLLATGDEIINGDTLNTNSQALAHALTAEGLSVGMHMSCSDNQQDMMDCLSFLTKHHQQIIITGGLGPTSDDRTRFALGRFLNLKLVEHAPAMEHINQRLCRAQLSMSSGNRQQALFPSETVLMDNPFGTAMGGYFYHNDILFMMLPGPPRECMPMFNTYGLPELLKSKKSDKVLLKWRLFGIAESEVSQTLDDALSSIDCETGYRLEIPYIEFKVRCTESDVNTVKSIIDPIVAPMIISTPECRASEAFRNKVL
jgi:nicotinamide-nucleotide amidase